MPPVTRTRVLLETLLEEPLEPWVASRRAEGQTWKAITTELVELTGGQCDINRETLRSWFAGVDPQTPLGHPA